MNNLGLDLDQVRQWFPHTKDNPYVLVRVSDEHSQALRTILGAPVRRCYISDRLLAKSSAENSVPQSEVIASKLPDAGPTMAGDFGEILVYLYQGTRQPRALGVTKWRLKEDRRKPAPHSDVVHLVLPSWPHSSAGDAILCAEVKTKSTTSTFDPIASAMADALKDRTGRLARTLVWLRERALIEDLGDVRRKHIDRFLKATEHPTFEKRFRAVAVISAELVTAELQKIPLHKSTEFTLIVVSVPQLGTVYTTVFAAALQATAR